MIGLAGLKKLQNKMFFIMKEIAKNEVIRTRSLTNDSSLSINIRLQTNENIFCRFS